MYDLPSDDAFRPAALQSHLADPAALQSHLTDSEMQQMQLEGREGLRPPPESEMFLRDLARRRNVMLHPELGVPVDEEYVKLEKERRVKLAQMRALAKTKTYSEVLQKVQETVENERRQMKDKEKFWAKDVTPLRILLVSTWRSGSTFLGQVLQQHPGVFQHYEPFSYAGVRQIRSGTEAFQSQQFLHRLLECRFSGQDTYLNYTRQHPLDMIGHNKRIWEPCSKMHRVDLCSNETFLTEACNMFPIQLVKSVRLRLNLTQLFLGETRLNAKVVFLIRDPRATVNSRKSSVRWCDDSPDCSSADVLCSDLKEDLKVAAALERLYPTSFTMVRYEDIANDPHTQIKKLFEFLGMFYSNEMANFVSEHTESEVEKPWSIARKSAARVSRWKENLKPEVIDEIEKACRPVIEKLNYDFVGEK
ncbi:hypothetical protein HAZT_HAZT002699 [Hyalella azteca]|uniref:Carbohydrate sulfotransferase 4 n=1 Tax=Hyalella azteca TaxID=294128 RepID=A0A6A0GW38_HYAAZ|nr:carbohydrate sulfotransferase 4 [Hyalella azteca]KAA0190189.1 hypothetical protein HAZT_HAZT002699 [Hyalella azteca]